MSLKDYVNLYVFTPGRAIFAVSQVETIATELGNKAIVAACKAARTQALDTLHLEEAWARSKTKSVGTRPKATAIDAWFDRTLSAIHGQVAGIVSAHPEDSSLAKEGVAFLDQVFPQGLAALTFLPYEDEVAQGERVLKRMKAEGDLEGAVKVLKLGDLVARLDEIVAQFRDALQDTTAAEVAYDKVRVARVACQERLLEVFVKILGDYHTSSAEHIERRTRLLAPILDQNARIGQSLKRRYVVSDVDPKTGEEDGRESPEP